MEILSIDIDFITSEYANKVPCGDIPNIKWDNFSKEESKNFQINYENFAFMMHVFINAIDRCKNVMFAVNHDSILLELEKPQYNNLNIINIDHHHDIVYGDERNVQSLEKYDVVNCGNWVWKLQYLNKIKSYLWIKNNTSDTFNEGTTSGKIPNNFKTLTKENSLNLFENKMYDFVFICLSPEYILPDHWFYYDIMLKIYEEKTKQKINFIQKIPEIKNTFLTQCTNIFDYRLK